jgi:hypothetical protein
VPATATKKVSHVYNGLVDDLIKKMKEEKLVGYNLFSKVVSDFKKLFVMQVWTNCGKTNS